MAKKGIVLMNLGSPDSTEVKDVRRYLDEFLMDGRVLDTPVLWRALLVKGIIVPFRAPKSAEAYKSIWTKEGSPLIVISEQQRDALQAQVDEPVVIAMRYGNPTPWAAFDELMQKSPELEEVIVVPMYPHYAMSSYETAVEYAKKVHKEKKYPFRLKFVPPFYKDAGYIDALSESIRPYLNADYDQIVFSYHGIPERHVHKTDPSGKHCLSNGNCCMQDNPAHAFCYRHQIISTTRLVAEKLNIPKEKYSFSFQSRLGRDEWLKPYTAVRLGEMPKEGIKKLLVVCPAFVADCLETLEEMAEEGKEIFLHAGGEQFTLIPCMNSQAAWIGALKNLLQTAK